VPDVPEAAGVAAPLLVSFFGAGSAALAGVGAAFASVFPALSGAEASFVLLAVASSALGAGFSAARGPPPRKSVSYQPPPFKMKAERLINFDSLPFASQRGHSSGAGASTFWMISLTPWQALQEYS
jgi:hypothetical protein